MKNHKLLRAVIIGCGKIAGGYDNLTDTNIRTHAKAYLKNSQTEFVAVADTSLDHARAFSARWQNPQFYKDARAMLERHKPDIISICTPDETHADYLDLALNFTPKAVWCEKPLTTNVKRAETLVDQYQKQKILLAVNYQRRFDPLITALKQEKDKKLGTPKKVVVHYGKGILHTGSHAVDLLIDWFGLPTDFKVFDSLYDFSTADPTIDARIMFDNLPAYFIGHDSRHYQIFKITVFGSLGKITIPHSEPTIMNSVLTKIVAGIVKSEPLPSTGATALETLRVCASLIKRLYETIGN